MGANINVVYNPFLVDQDIYVYENGACINHVSVDLSRVPNAVNGLRKQYNAETVNLYGNQDYLQKFKAEMNSTFSDGSCEINIVNKE